MKRIIFLSVILFALSSFTVEARGNHYFVGEFFYSELAPYGRWIEIDYGVVVWKPTIFQVAWMPYQTGRWIWTSDGWYWDSYEPFGYITYHYGRWYYDDYYGWLWYPDYEWAPAWVEWRYDSDYIGWAPLHPYALFSISIGIHFTSVYVTPHYHWHFVSFKHFCHPYVYNYYVASDYRYRIYSQTNYRTNYTYYNGRVQNRGIDVNYVRVRSGENIRQRDIIRVRDKTEFTRKGDGDQIRTLDLKRDDLTRNTLNRMEIQRDKRKTTLDVSKVKVGKREVVNNRKDGELTTSKKKDMGTVNRNKELKTRSEENNKIIKQNRTEVTRENKTEKNVRTYQTDRKNNDQLRKQNEKKIKTSDRNITNDTNFKRIEQDPVKEKVQRNTNTRNQKTEIRVDRNKLIENKTVTRNEVLIKRENKSGNNNNERKMQTNRTMSNDKSRERSRR